MIHNNPGLAPYESKYNDPHFLKKRNFDGKVFDLFDCAQFALLWDGLDAANPDREKVFPAGSEERLWVLERKKDLKKKYREAQQCGLDVLFMMDIIVLPKRIGSIYPEIFNEDHKIDIRKPKMKEIMDVLFDEIFSEFPEVSGIYIRFGETYVGEAYGTPWHFGNNPILGDEVEAHLFLIRYLMEKVCRQHNRKIYYRTWGFGAFQYDPECYLQISGQIEPHEKFFFCIKHTAGDFHRDFPFNQSLNKGKHRQVVEIQAAREYEGKGAYPNYIGSGVISGFEEFKWLMKENEVQSLSEIFGDSRDSADRHSAESDYADRNGGEADSCSSVGENNSRIAGVWIWPRGGGWDGPYINGRNGKDGTVAVEHGEELWADVNTYVISSWAKDPSCSDRYYAMKYAREELGMNEKDAVIFYEILMQSERAVLLGRGTNSENLSWDVFWTRDQNIEYSRLMLNIRNAVGVGQTDLLLKEKRRSVEIWEDICRLAQRLSDDLAIKRYIVTTCRYGFYLYSLYEVMYRANVFAVLGGRKQEVEKAVDEYEKLWEEWEELFRTEPGCPTLYEKKDEYLDLIGYDWNKGFDSAINPLRMLDEDGRILAGNMAETEECDAWGLKKG